MKLLKYILIIGIITLIYFFHDNIINNISYIFNQNQKIILDTPNEYYKNKSYAFAKQSSDFIPYSKQDIINIYYSVLDRGYDTFTFYCPKEYTSCITDLEEIISSQEILSNLNYFTSPFNSETKIKTNYSYNGEINIQIEKLYTKEEIKIINNKIDEIILTELNQDMNLEDKILKIHDYIINTTKYDTAALENNSNHKSYSSYGALIEGYSTCNGYADAMALFLDRFGIINYRVASDTHVWNAVYLSNKWYHLDLTWDDPITENSNKDTLQHKFYLIDTNTLESYNIEEHTFNKTIYREMS